MTINKVLNRPMFRKAALKKGHLKPIHAQTGVMVGAPTQDIRNTRFRPPAVVPQPGFMQRAGTFTGRLGRDIKSFPGSVPKQVMNPRTRVPFGMGGGLGRFVAGAGLYDAISAGTTKLGMQPGMLKTGVDLGLSGLLYFNPIARAGGLAYGAYNMARPLVGGAVDYVTQRPMGTTSRALDPRTYLGEPSTLGASLFTPTTGKRLTRKQRRDLRKQQKIAEKEGSEVAIVPKEADDALTVADNKTKVGNQEVVDITKVANNTSGATPPVIGAEDTVKEKGFKEPLKETKTANQNVLKNTGQTSAGTGEGGVTAGDGTPVTDDTIARAKQIRKELLDGRSSQAKLVFLANLASGLMSGTTAKAGIGGALEVFGKALGPAVNNYATIKLKENELENDLMSDALELASDEIEARNALLEGRTGLDFEKFGIIQFRDKNGNPINRTGGLLKNGTYVVANLGQSNEDNSQPYSMVPVGSFSKFIESSFAEKNQGEVIKSLAGKYKALGIGKETIRILEDAAATGKTLGGPKGRLALITTRLQSALSDFNINIGSYESGLEKAQKFRDDFKTQLMNDGLSEDQANKFLNDNFGSIDSQFKKIMSEMNMFRDETTAANLERLAINETVLTYALANSLKDKDRLTQKDIQMAQKLVNVFPFFRGSGQVVRSLEAVNERILGDIRSSELEYGEFGGDTATITNFRRQYGLLPQIEGEDLDVGFAEDTTADLLEKLGAIK